MTHPTRITRKIEIDMGHRVTNHGSKCRNVHGHRYVIEAEVEGPVETAVGETQGMVVDFGALKTVMMARIDRDFDHGLALWVEDSLVELLVPPGTAPGFRGNVEKLGTLIVHSPLAGRVILMNVVPTAENLAKVWYDDLVRFLTDAGLKLTAVTVYETPNCWATYRPGA